MPLPGTRADALQIVLTGAVSHAAAQPDPDLSLGGFRSSTRCDGRSYTLVDALNNVLIDHVAGDNETGDGILTAVDADYLAWTSPDGTQGEAVQVLNGQQRLLDDASAPGKYLLVSRTSDEAMQGAATVRIFDRFNNVMGMGNANLSTGLTYRCVGFVAVAPYTIVDLQITVAENVGSVDIFATAVQPTQPNGSTYSIVNETTMPGGTFTPGSSVTIPIIRPGEWAPLWVRRDIAILNPDPSIRSALSWTYNVVG